MHLHEITEAPNKEANSQLQLALRNLMAHYNEKVAPIKKEVDEMYAEQYLPATLNRYKQSVKSTVNTIQYLNNAVEQQRELLKPEMIKSFTNTKSTLFKQMRIQPKSIHDKVSIANLGVQYTRGNGPLGDANAIMDIAEEFNRFLKDKFAQSKKISGKPIDNPWGNPVTPGIKQPTSDRPGPRPDPKGLDPKLPTVVDPGISGEVLSPEHPDYDKLDKKNNIIDGEWSVVDKAMKLLPKRQLRLTDQRPKAGDYVMWTGGARSSRSGQPNYGKVASVRDNGVLNVTSINQQPNSSRQGRPFGLNPKSVEKTMSKQQMSKILPQSSPSKGAIKQGIASNSSGYKYTPKA